ncbi:MAG: DUF72 domain-containing protein [Actinomycetota bacterium]
MRKTVHVGTSGWQYASWRHRFYEGIPQARWLEHYAETFTTVEINNSFYRLPEVHTFESWRARVPAAFSYAVKGNRFITHLKRLKDPQEHVPVFWERAKHLGAALGPVLWQMPPSLSIDLPRLEEFIAALPGDMRSAFEFRHPSWITDEVRAMLDQAGAALVLPDRPGARFPSLETLCVSGWSYIRFHQGHPTSPGYSTQKLNRWSDRIEAMPVEEVFVYFNNDPEGAAIVDALALIEMLARRGLNGPRMQNVSVARAQRA